MIDSALILSFYTVENFEEIQHSFFHRKDIHLPMESLRIDEIFRFN